MAELVALIASITALIQITSQVATGSRGFFRSIKDAPTDIVKLWDEMEALRGVLGRLSHQPEALQALEAPIRVCIADLKDLQAGVEPKTGIRNSIRRYKWPLREKETTQAIAKIERHKSLFTLALTADQVQLSAAIKTFSQNNHMLAKEILDLVKNEVTAQQMQRQKEAATHAGERRIKILNWLYLHDVDVKHLEISGKRQPHTGVWLLQKPEFRCWIDRDPAFRLLWGYGIPGAGKTFLSPLVIDELEVRARATQAGVAYIYFHYQEQDQQTPVSVLSSLVKQLLLQAPQVPLPDELEDLYSDFLTKQKRPTLSDVQKVLLATSQLFSPAYFLFDALDECHKENQRKELLPFFHTLAGHGASIFLTSRPYPWDIEVSLSAQSVGKIELSADGGDIRIYVEEMIEGDPHARDLIQKSFREEIVSALVRCAKGMFLLVHFSTRDLCGCVSMNQVRATLKALEAETSRHTSNPLDEIYDRAMRNINAQHPNRVELALKVLLWLVKARRTLTIDELRTAVAVEKDQFELTEADMPSTGMLVEVCAGLAIIDEKSSTIQLAHYSVQEYLIRNVVPSSANLQTVVVCITFLSFEAHNHPSESECDFNSRVEASPFLCYAVQNLPSHLGACDQRLTTELLLKFLTDQNTLYAYIQALFTLGSQFQPPWHTSALCGAVYFRHHAAARQLLEECADVSMRGWRAWPALFLAVVSGDQEMVQLLLHHGAKINDLYPKDMDDTYEERPTTALFIAIEKRDQAMVHFLLENGADANLPGSCAGIYIASTPIFEAGLIGDEAIMKLLLAHGADIDGGLDDPVYSCQSPLVLAVGFQRRSMAEFLLANGADTEATALQDTPLYMAVFNDDEDMFQLLLEHGVNIEARIRRDSDSCTLLWLGSAWGQKRTVRLLCNAGADMEAEGAEIRSRVYGTPLFAAVAFGRKEVVEILYEMGANRWAKNRLQRTILSVAAAAKDEEIFQFILDHGADLEYPDVDGWTALHHAVDNSREQAVRLLLERDANREACSNNGQTPLDLAVSKGNKTVVALLQPHPTAVAE